MISFSCSHCGLKLKVKTEFAGRSSKCPTCKKPLVVPQPEPTEGLPAGQIDGTASSVHQAGVDGGVTLGDTARAGQKSVRDLLAKGKAGGQRYVVSEEIARGGMGAVLRAIDCDIRREVAVKYMLDEKDPKKKARFVEEAQITGQLEHPNIVPIHELGVDAKKRLFFSMKMVKGRSLAQVLDDLRKNPKQAEKEWSLTRLLNIFVSVCNGMAYAHSRGVVNRDCKPANVMIGDFGEVYVMDWGLAKVLGQESPVASVVAGPASAASASSSSSGVSSKVSTSREPDADLTQEGAIVGTPVYMPPEQAMGEIGEIDQRSDVYSLGAILYEMLTLVPPIEKDGGYLNILMRVSEGDIKAPETRTPQRAGRIPKELSAIAMKALAKDKKARYQTVEELRKDIERFQEGRSVSAKEDTRTEVLWKFAKRNKGLSAGAVGSFLILLCSLWFISKAWLATNRAYAAYQQEQRDKQARTQRSVPAFLRSAQLALKERQFEDALAQAEVAIDFAPDSADARLLKGQLLVVQQKYEEAQVELGEYLKSKPKDERARELLLLCRRSKPNDTSSLVVMAELFSRQQNHPLADGMLYSVSKNAVEAREKLLAIFRQRVETAWKGLGSNLTLNTQGQFALNLWPGRTQVVDLEPLKGMPLTSLFLDDCKMRDLTPLQSMPLTELSLKGCAQVSDLAPLRGMPLTSLNLSQCRQIQDLTPLKGMPLTSLNLVGVQMTDLTALKGIPLTALDLGGCGQVRDLSPLKDMPLITLDLNYCGQIKDLTPLHGMPLTTLILSNCQITDLTPLQGMPLTSLSLFQCGHINDLSPLKGMPLTTLNITNSQITDLSPLKGMPLTTLALSGSQVKDLSPLEGMKLERVDLTPKNITKGMDVLRQMKSLKTINHAGKAHPATEFWKRYDAGEFK